MSCASSLVVWFSNCSFLSRLTSTVILVLVFGTVYLSAKAKAEAWLKEKMEFLESMKKRALENLSKNKETLEERAKKIQSELVSANELSTQNSEAAEVC